MISLRLITIEKIMLIHRRVLLACALACGTTLIALGESGQEKGARRTGSAPAASISLEPCEVPGTRGGVQEKVRCGTYEVFENRATKTGRTIKLKIVIFPATGRDKAADPLFYIPGGPGSSATEDAPYVAEGFAKVRERRDLVFVDQRGTGGSNPLNCDFFNPSDLASYLGFYFPLADVRKCREQLEPKADLKLYTTDIAMDDLDEVRAALGYERINISGASYGTRVSGGLERVLPGKNLIGICKRNDARATKIAIDIMKGFSHKEPGNIEFTNLEKWIEGLKRAEKTIFPRNEVKKAQGYYAELIGSSKKSFLLHGDLHHGNILSAEREDFLVIDPKGIIGDIGYEISVFLNNPRGWISTHPNRREILKKRIEMFSQSFEIEPEALRKWAYAESVLSACWTFEDNGKGWEKWLGFAEVWNTIKI
jgi:hypothetical protein